MSPEQIRTVRDACYTQIKKANEDLEEIRKICQHTNTHEGLYSWRIGAVDPAKICSDCGKMIEFLINAK